MRLITISMLLLCLNGSIWAQSTEFLNDKKFSLMSGLSQPLLLKGFNIAGTYMTGRWYFEYSHGISLNLEANKGIGITTNEKAEFSSIYVPYSTGGGVGYRMNKNLQFFWELKVHKFDLIVKNTEQKLSYNTFEMGPAVSYRLFFDKQKRFFIEPVVRYWFTTAVFGNDDFSGKTLKINRLDESIFEHKAHQFGLFFNASAGLVIK